MSTALETRRHGRSVGSAVTVGVMTVVGWLAVAAGGVLAVLAVTGDLSVEVPVQVGHAAPAYMEVVLPCVEGWSLDGGSCAPAASADEWPGGAALPVQHASGLVATTHDVDPLPAVLSTVAMWGGVLAAGVSLLVLLPVFRSTAAGRPFESGNGLRLAVAATVVAGAWTLSIAGPALGARAIIGSIETSTIYSESGPFDMPADWLVFDLRMTWWPAIIVLLLVALAVTTHRGTRLAADTEGLV